MHRNSLVLDLAVGGGLAFLLLSIFVVDKFVNSETGDHASNVKVVQAGGTLLGNHRIVKQIEALGDLDRLEKLKVVRLTTKVSFAEATNVNDITVMWCWEPNIIIRYQEEFSDEAVRRQSFQIPPQQMINHFESSLEFGFDAKLKREYRRELRRVLAARKYRSLLDYDLLLKDRKGYRIFNGTLSIPLKPSRAKDYRTFLYALSISNLIPVSRLKFHIEEGKATTIRNRRCNQFLVRNREGSKLSFDFDAETNLLTKISHLGHDPRITGRPDGQVFWEHYFSGYKEADGIQQWRHLESFIEGRLFMNLRVTDVEFFDFIPPELRR